MKRCTHPSDPPSNEVESTVHLKDVNWNQFYCFYEVAKSLSMSHAAERLGVSVPTVSEQIKRLEGSLGLKLFARKGRSLDLSDDGFALFDHAKTMFATGHKMLETLTPYQLGGQTVRVGIPEISLLVGMNFVCDYWDLFAPYGIVTTVRESLTSQLIERLIRNEIDWAILQSAPKLAGIECAAIGEFEVVFSCAASIYSRFRNAQHIVRALPLVRTNWDLEINEAVDSRLKEAGIYPREIVTSDHREFCVNLIQRNRAIGTLSTYTLLHQKSLDQIVGFQIGAPITIKLYAAWNKAKTKSIIIRKLVELIESHHSLAPADPELQIKVSDVPEDWLRSSRM